MKPASDSIFRSINLRLDAGHPDRFAHFFPTSKSANIVRAILQGEPDPASLVVASYGSGKSLAAGAAALILDNAPKMRPHMDSIVQRIGAVNRPLGRFARDWAKGGMRGLPVLLEGHQSDLTEAILSQGQARFAALGKKNPAKDGLLPILQALADQAKRRKHDRIAIIWDEFGQHLEALAAAGQADKLGEIQQLAEWAARQSKPRVTLTLLLHQNFSQYAGNLSQAARSSWRKIEGRFGSVHYVEDSDEMYDLIANVVSGLRQKVRMPGEKHFADAAKTAAAAGMFGSYGKSKQLPQLLAGAYPLLPATLHLLPRTSSRLAQNERTIFSFLRDQDMTRSVSLQDLYRYFSESMQADTGLGGTHRRWLETESALTKASSIEEQEAIAAAALLGLGAAGERTRVSRKALAFAITGANGITNAAASRSIGNLVDRKLLLHRKNIDDIAVWHGTDVDVRSQLNTEKNRLAGHADILGFLRTEHPAPSWRPVRHNVKNAIRRYFQGRYIRVKDMAKKGSDSAGLALLPPLDGAVIYCLAEDDQDIGLATAEARKRSKANPGLIFSVPSEPLPIGELVTEILALRNLQQDAELIGSDPFVQPELEHMIDAAQEHLTLVLDRIIRPDGAGSKWFACGGSPRQLHSSYGLQEQLSKIADDRYSLSPIINNEMIVRHRVSRPVTNARKKLLLAILERSGQPHLDFDKSATTPNATMYRTVLDGTGLYKSSSAAGEWATAKSLRDAGLSDIWSLIKEFFTEPGAGKKPADLIAALAAPPYGTRLGLIPILFSAGMKAFAKVIAIRKQGKYLPDVLASEIEDVCANPDQYTVDVLEKDASTSKLYSSLIEVFSKQQPQDLDLLRELHDAIAVWRSRLPAQALVSSHVSAKAKKLQLVLRGDIDPVVLAQSKFPEIAGKDLTGKAGLAIFSGLVHEIESIVDGYTSKAIGAIGASIAISPDADDSMLRRVQDWAECIGQSDSLQGQLDIQSRSVLARCHEAASGKYNDASFARAMSAILLGRDFLQWDDASVQQFADRLRDTVHNIESAALFGPSPSPALIPLLDRRIRHLRNLLDSLKKETGNRKQASAK